jgi:ribosomal protein RSM22 (predicted rRNA methylase)
MRLPAALNRAIDAEAAQHDRKLLTRAVEDMSFRYRSRAKDTGAFVSTPLHRAAYVITRLPATFAAVAAVLSELKNRMPGFEPVDLLDLGAGPGTATWAASVVFPSLQRATLVEQDPEFIATGRHMVKSTAAEPISHMEWVRGDVRKAEFQAHELVVISYALGELSEPEAMALVNKALKAAKVLAVIEPGTPPGCGVVHVARAEMLAAKAHIVAPCSQEGPCPMLARKDDWCHFAQRLERTSLHRNLKSGELGYEDEKFSYMVAAKEEVAKASARIIRHPLIGKGHIKLELCTPDGILTETVTRSDKENFRLARRAKWGDAWNGGRP